MRVKNDIEDLNYNETKEFFNHRAGKFSKENPYVTTMFQDNHPELVVSRNKMETEKLLPMLELSDGSKVLDIACGIGRWSDAIKTEIKEYCGVDFSDELVAIARERNKELANRSFLIGSVNDIRKVLADNGKGPFNVAIMIGILMYINDTDLVDALKQVADVLEENSTICIREPIGVDSRLTLKDFYSEELKEDYHAIYRTRDELIAIFEKSLFEKGFIIDKEGYLFEENNLNNRKETIQYYFIMKR